MPTDVLLIRWESEARLLHTCNLQTERKLMQTLYRACRMCALLTLSSCLLCHAGDAKESTRKPAPFNAIETRIPSVIEVFTADERSLQRAYPLRLSLTHAERFERFYSSELASLSSIDFDSLSQEDKVDYLLLKNQLAADLHQMAIKDRQLKEMQPLLPFAGTIEELLEKKRLMARPDAERDGETNRRDPQTA